MKRKSIRIAATIAGISAALLLCTLLAGVAMVPHLREHSTSFNLIFPPPDLYAPLASCPLAFGEEGKVFEVPFSPRYPGTVALNVVVAKAQSNAVGYTGQYLLDVTILDAGGRPVLQQRMAKPAGGNFFGGPDHSGMTLVWFRVPEIIALRRPATARVTVVTADADMDRQYGPLRLVVDKWSDE